MCARLCRVRLRDLEAEEPRRVEAEDLGARRLAQMAHRPLDRLGGMRPGAFMMGIVVGPHDIVDETMALDEIEARPVLPEGGEAVETEVLAGELRELGPHPEMMFEVGLRS